MNYPVELQYTKSHEWVKTEGDVTVVGISDFAQDALGDVVFVNLPGVGDEVTAEEAFGDVESVKAVSDLVSPVAGVVVEVNAETDFVGKNEKFVDFVKGVAATVAKENPADLDALKGCKYAVNEELLDHPELLNSDPYGNWLIKVEQVTDTEELLDAAAYEAFCAQEG